MVINDYTNWNVWLYLLKLLQTSLYMEVTIELYGIKLLLCTFGCLSKALRWYSYVFSVSTSIETLHMIIKVSHLTFDSNYILQFVRIFFNMNQLQKRCEEIENTLCNAFIRASSLLVTTTLRMKSLSIKLKFYRT